MSFALRKWYLDCIAESGESAVIYCAELRWRKVALRYGSLLQFDDAHGARVRSTLRGCPEPSVEGGRLLLDAPALEVEGSWDALDPPASADLIAGMRWECVQPRSSVRMKLPGGAALEGLGYAEVLSLEIPPWRLPIDELRWGRFVARDHGVVWIDWRGPYPLTRVLVDGKAQEAAVADDGISGTEATLRLEPGPVLRSGRIGETALSIIPNLSSIFPGRIVGLEETKWRSRGTLDLQGSRHEGFAVHEVVRWPK